MLVLRMLRNESVMIIDSSGTVLGEIKLLPTEDTITKLGFDFPKTVQIVRKKLYDEGWSNDIGKSHVLDS